MNFEELLNNFNNTVNLPLFFVNLATATLLSVALKYFFIYFGQSINNRIKFSSNFMPLALGTFLIITIIKSSVALSLGLVGALSIVRFRAAIKEPEELIFLFLVIGVGLATGANYPILASISILSILLLLFLNNLLSNKSIYKRDNMLYVNINTPLTNIEEYVKVLKDKMMYVELKRMDRTHKGTDITFICKASGLDAITSAQDLLMNVSSETKVSIVDQPDLIV